MHVIISVLAHRVNVPIPSEPALKSNNPLQPGDRAGNQRQEEGEPGIGQVCDSTLRVVP
ncbi:hypothetical protein BDV32DRAFT_124724 [Aspergillus pseudonomiae]|uniref:Uncharacterized protein n=1 Tax=Aspergillus pseudonomiae TaxID=1506151 RepID=A0A5N6I043_9EURO|nr:uncharacterized protein BDV37DRAFT_242371 [Aspergillus pseudonomiae]KAB8259040.1 hypothetical protein BDV32DRAFT_124724 [Aspergillus pseudonomiae]KAE8406666.1 hypothetical protein BDV37DRAFT_242371 [Aspergillus pseudonomiae]